MSLFDYKKSMEISAEDFPFYALIMSAFRQADSSNFEKLESIFPEVSKELKARYNAPGGILGEEVKQDDNKINNGK